MKAKLKYGLLDEVAVDVSGGTLAHMSKQSVQKAIEGLLQEVGIAPGETTSRLSKAMADPKSVIEVKTDAGYHPVSRGDKFQSVLVKHPNPEFQVNLPHAGG